VHQVELELQNEELRQSRLQTEEALERYRSLFHFAPVGYAILNAEGAIQEINYAGARLLRSTPSRLVGQPFASSSLETGESDGFRRFLTGAFASEKNETCEVELKRAIPPAQLTLTATSLARAGKPLLLLAFTDSTERNEHEKRRAEIEQALRETDRNKNEFLSALSHELRNPLAAMRMSLAVFTRAEPTAAHARKAQDVLDRQLTQLTRLIDDLLDLTRISRGKFQLKLEKFDLAELLRRTLEDHRASFESHGIQLDEDVDPIAVWVNADPVRLVQAVSNILGNALKFSSAHGHAKVGLRAEGRCAVLTVRDNGVGIAPDMLPRVFEPFAQAPQAVDRALGGLGLGLAVVKGLIELHGGTVGIASEGVGRGSVVTLSLPLVEPLEASEPASDPVTSSQHRRRVLIIDDNVDSADSLRDALAFSGHEVIAAYDGSSGLAAAFESRPEVILCDIGLPGMDGYEVAKAVRADPTLRGAYLVAITGYSREEDREMALAAGFDRHLTKPPSMEILEQLIAKASAP
jgi:two-component system CheB/CheR fusion protein